MLFMKYLLVFLLLVSICLNAPASDEVTMLEVPYSDHHWYSGTR